MKLLKLSSVVLILCFLFCLPALAQREFSFAGIDGQLSGTLEYADFKDDKRVMMPIIADIRSFDGGDALNISYILDDFGRIYRDSARQVINRTKKTIDMDGEEFAYDEEAGKLSANGTLIENSRTVPVRYTIAYDGKTLEILKETGKPLRFRNRYLLTRSKNDTSPLRVFSPAQMKEDFAVLKRALLELHPGLYRYNTPAEINETFAAAEKKLDTPLQEDTFFKLFAQILSEVKCYHTYPNPFNQTDQVKNGFFNRRTYFPFYFEIIDRRMFVTAGAAARKLARGSEITKINGVPVADIIKQLLTATYADGKGTVEHRLKTLELKRFDAEMYSIFDMIFPVFFPPADNVYKIEAIDFATGKKSEFDVLAMAKSERTDEMTRRYGKSPTYDDGWKFEVLDDNIAYLKMDHFQTWRLSVKIGPFLADAFKQMREKRVENLIIDIRGSSGGDDGVYREIFKYLARKPFPCRTPVRNYFKKARAEADLLKYASSWDPSFKENLAAGYPENIYRKSENGMLELLDSGPPCEPIQPYENNFRGKTYLLVSSGNASAAFTLPYYAKKLNFATLIGQETGGNLRGFNGSQYLTFTLPNSKFTFDISLLASVIDEKAEDSGVVPDVVVVQLPADVGNGYDRELVTAKQLIASRRSITR